MELQVGPECAGASGELAAAGTTAAKVTKSTNTRGINILLITKLPRVYLTLILKMGGVGVKEQG